MNWTIDLNMNDGIVASSRDDDGDFCIQHNIKGIEKTVNTQFGPIVYEYEHVRTKYLLPSAQVKKSPLVRPEWPVRLSIFIVFFIGVFTITLIALKLWGILF
jgi:hypothetical protein